MAIVHEVPPVNLRWVLQNDGSRVLEMGHWWSNTETGEKGLMWEPIKTVSSEPDGTSPK